jgi:hypothetical protein
MSISGITSERLSGVRLFAVKALAWEHWGMNLTLSALCAVFELGSLAVVHRASAALVEPRVPGPA